MITVKTRAAELFRPGCPGGSISISPIERPFYIVCHSNMNSLLDIYLIEEVDRLAHLIYVNKIHRHTQSQIHHHVTNHKPQAFNHKVSMAGEMSCRYLQE